MKFLNNPYLDKLKELLRVEHLSTEQKDLRKAIADFNECAAQEPLESTPEAMALDTAILEQWGKDEQGIFPAQCLLLNLAENVVASGRVTEWDDVRFEVNFIAAEIHNQRADLQSIADRPVWLPSSCGTAEKSRFAQCPRPAR